MKVKVGSFFEFSPFAQLHLAIIPSEGGNCNMVLFAAQAVISVTGRSLPVTKKNSSNFRKVLELNTKILALEG